MAAVNVEPTVERDGAKTGSRLGKFDGGGGRFQYCGASGSKDQRRAVPRLAVFLAFTLTGGARLPESRPCAVASLLRQQFSLGRRIRLDDFPVPVREQYRDFGVDERLPPARQLAPFSIWYLYSIPSLGRRVI